MNYPYQNDRVCPFNHGYVVQLYSGQAPRTPPLTENFRLLLLFAHRAVRIQESALNEEHGCRLPLGAVIGLGYIISITACYTHNTGSTCKLM